MVLDDGAELVALACLRGARPDPVLEIDKWSEEHITLPPEASKSGKYRIAETPMARRILQVLSPMHAARRVVVKGASQMLKTQVGINFVLASAHRAPSNILVLEPTDNLAKRLSARIAKAVKDSKALRAIFAPPRSRDRRNSTRAKEFEGGTLHIETAGSAANLSELAARYWWVDEARELMLDIEGQGNPLRLVEARATTFEHNSKGLITSSPGEAGSDPIDAEYERGTQEVYLLPCPHCGHHHELVLENFHYKRDPDTGYMARAWFHCPSCGAEIDERHKGDMLRDADMGGSAHWFAQSRGDGETVSFHVSAFYAPVWSISWLKLARELAYARAQYEKGSPTELKSFYNTRLALSWKDSQNDITAEQLQTRSEAQGYTPRMLPDWALVVTVDVDTQINRLEAQAHAWGPGLRHCVIDYQVFMGSPAVPPDTAGSCWQALDEFRATAWPHPSGVVIYASVQGIDSGGANTQDVYNYGAARQHMHCVVHHGATRPNRPIISALPKKADIDWQGKSVPGGVLLWEIGTDTAKDHLQNRLKLEEGDGAMHFHAALELTWFEGLLAESRRLVKRKGGYRWAWVPNASGVRNEPLDLTVGNLAMAHHLGLHKWTSHDWARLREKLIPRQLTPDLFAAQAIQAAQQTQPAAPQAPAPAAPPPPPPPAAAAPAHMAPAAPAAYTGRRTLSRGIG